MEEPELIGRSKHNLDFQLINPTAADAAAPGAPEGTPGGYYKGNFKIKIRKTFTPEHGLIGIYAIPRIEGLSIGTQPPMLNWDADTAFWSPERDAGA